MKHNNTFELRNKFNNTKSDSPSKETINNVVNYAKALEVKRSKDGKVFMCIVN